LGFSDALPGIWAVRCLLRQRILRGDHRTLFRAALHELAREVFKGLQFVQQPAYATRVGVPPCRFLRS